MSEPDGVLLPHGGCENLRSYSILEAIDMDRCRAGKKATMAIALPDADAGIEPVPTSGGGRKPEPERSP